MKTIRRSGYTVAPFPHARLATLDYASACDRRHNVHRLVRVDVTRPRRLLAEHEVHTGERLSFTAFLMGCIARTLDEDHTVRAYRRGRRLVIFDSVDISALVEYTLDGKHFAEPFVIRAANRKTLRELHREIRARQEHLRRTPGRIRAMWNVYSLIPVVLRRLLWRVYSASPRLHQRVGGTVLVTAVGMFGRGVAGWGIMFTDYTVGVTVGSIAEQPGVVGGQIVPREYLYLTLTFNHDIVDDVTATRFSHRLAGYITSGYLLPATAPA